MSDQRSDGPSDGPIWRRDFPITSAGEEAITRRDFTRFLVAGSGAFATGTVGVAIWSALRSINEGEPRPIVALDSLAVGDDHLFAYPGERDAAILVRLGDDDLRAYSQQCTHLGCVVFWEADEGDEGELVCPCHEGHFDVRSGDPTAGPPDRPLGRIEVEVRDDGLVWALGRTR